MTNDIIRNVNRIKTENEMAKNQNQKNNDFHTENQSLSKENQTKNRGEFICSE